MRVKSTILWTKELLTKVYNTLDKSQVKSTILWTKARITHNVERITLKTNSVMRSTLCVMREV